MAGDSTRQVTPVTIVSPCVNRCEIDPGSGHCRGCARTLWEIGAWSTGTPEWRDRVMRELPHRHAR